MFTTNLVPGQGFQRLEVWRQQTGTHPSGRPLSLGYAKTGQRLYVLVGDASQREAEEWRQNGHPISHKLIQYGTTAPAGPTDYLVSPGGRFFYVQGRREPGNLGATIIYYAEERQGLDEQYSQPGGSGDSVGGEGDTGPTAGESVPGI